MSERIAYFEISDLDLRPLSGSGAHGDVLGMLFDVDSLSFDALRFESREIVEEEQNAVQLVPVAVFVDERFQRILVVRKGRKSASKAEQGKDLIWVGGHACREDMPGECTSVVDFAKSSLNRELEEELGVRLDEPAVAPFLVRDSTDYRSGRHMAMCFVVCVDPDELHLSYSTDELVKPRKNSKSGTFAKTEALFDGSLQLEAWGRAIAAHVFGVERRLADREANEELVSTSPEEADARARVDMICFDEGSACADGSVCRRINERYEVYYNERSGYSLLGYGGSSVVLKARQLLLNVGYGDAHIDRAIKFFLFSEKQAGRLGMKVAGENYRNEIGNIVALNHQNVLKVIDGGACMLNSVDLYAPYMVTELVDGLTMGELIDYVMTDCESEAERDERLKKYLEVVSDEDRAFAYMNELLDGICYLHSRFFYHCDIAPKNVFMQQQVDGAYHVVLGDLGAGVMARLKGRDDTVDTVRVIGSRKYMPDDLVGRRNDMVSLAEFKEMQPRWDFVSTVRTLQEFVGATLQAFKSARGWPGRLSTQSLEVLQAYLRNVSADSTTVGDLRAKVAWFAPDQVSIAKVPELSEASWQIRPQLLPLYSYASSLRVSELVKHPTVQRLRKVPQLLMGSIVFPGANHTRFEHTLGTYEMMRRVLRAALRDKRCAVLLDRRSIEIGLVGALMMSVTRFPFSYVIHEVKHQGQGGPRFFPKLTRRALFDRALNAQPPSGSDSEETLGKVIARWFPNVLSDASDGGKDFSELMTVVCGPDESETRDPQLQFIYSLLRSTIDVRVLDFLARDAYHLGVKDAPDFTGIIEHLTAYNNRVAVHRTGLSEVEHVVIQRYWMFRNYYWNEPSRLFMAVSMWALCELYLSSEQHASECRLAGESGYVGLEEELVSCFLSDDENAVKTTLLRKAQELGRQDVAKVILRDMDAEKARPRYKRLDIIYQTDDDATLSSFCKDYRQLSYSEKEELRRGLQHCVMEAAGADASELLERDGAPIVMVDMPCGDEDKIGAEVNIVIEEDNREAMQLPVRSPIVNSIIANFDGQLRPLRVFVDKDFFKKHRSKTPEMRSAVRSYITSMQN